MVQNIFNTDDYNSSNGMNPKIWGPALWFVLHIISFNYPVSPNKNDKRNYFIFLKSLENILPCKSCRDNLKEHFKNIDMNIFDNRDTFSQYIYKLHNIVNSTLDKEKYSSYKSVKYTYQHFRYSDNIIHKNFNNLQSSIKIIKYNKNNESIKLNNLSVYVKK